MGLRWKSRYSLKVIKNCFVTQKPQKILILGCSGSGKSTLARFISENLEIPTIHLDVFFWQPGWIEMPSEQWREEVKNLASSDCWVMDGTFPDTFDLRIPQADMIIVIKLPIFLCLYRAVARVFKYSKTKRRLDMASGCDEKVDFSFYKYIWTFNQKVYPRIISGIKEHKAEEKTVFLNSRQEVTNFMDSFGSN